MRATRLSRRRFLQVSAASAIVAACEARPTSTPISSGPASPTPPPSPTPSPSPTSSPDELPFAVWRQLRERIRTSPDHLAARAETLVAAKDAAAIARFVADEIATLPGQEDGFGNAETAARWGTRATLRCGAGTPREKAELLAELLRAAGFGAEVDTADLRPDLAARPDLLFRPIERRFAPDVDDPTLDDWRGLLGFSGLVAPMAVLDRDGAESGALAGALGPLLTASEAAPFDRRIGTRIPVVVTAVDGAERVLNPLLPGGGAGEETISGTPVVASPPSSLRDVQVTVLVARSDDPNDPIVVAEGEWAAEDLVGRMIQVAFAPVGGFAALVGRSFEEVTLFTPVLAVRGADLDQAATASLATAGKTISTGGRVLEDAPDGTPLVDGMPLASGPSNPAGAAAVVALRAGVRADAFPTVRLALSPEDAAGQIVEGLGAADIAVEEDGRPVAFLLAANRPRPPRLLLLFDSSRSIPSEFRGREAAALGRQLAEGVLEEHPDAAFLVGGVNYGTITPSGDWTSDPATVEANVGSVPGEGSDLWMALGAATTMGASVVVLITDGDATDPPEEVARTKPWIAAGPPVVVVGVGAKETAAIEAWVALTDGAYLPAERVGQAVKGVARALAAVQRTPYRLEYVAKREGPARRTVRVTIGTASAEAQYTVPPPLEQLPAPALAGIYLRVRVSGAGEITRTLAGLDHREYHRRGDPVPEAITDEVLGALFGGVLLAVEAGAPTLAAWLDGFLAAKLTAEPFWAAARANDVRGMLDALPGVTPVPPAVLLPLTGALPTEVDATSLTFPAGLRCVLFTEMPIFGQGMRRRVDILPTAGWLTAADDRKGAFARTLERTARLAVAEGALFKTSTLGRLAGRSLELLPAGTVAPREGPLAAQARRLDEFASDDRLVPADGGPFAFWVVRPATGELLGILPDGSGGGAEVEGAHIIDKTAAALGLAASLAELGFAAAAFIALQKAIAKTTLVLAAWVSTIGDEAQEDPNLGGPLKGLACELVKEALAALFHSYEAFDRLDKLGEMAGRPLIHCP